MRHLLLFCLFSLLLSTEKISAQKSFPESDGHWAGYIYIYPLQECWDYTYTVNGDTTINSKAYHKLYYSDNSYIGAFRNEGLKVYYKNDNEKTPYPYFPFASEEEVLLYDFGLSEGDEYTYATDENGNPYTAQVDEISSFINNGTTLKTWSWTNVTGNVFFLDVWIEGIGSWGPGFFPSYLVSEATYGLNTYTENEEVYTLGSDPGGCILATEDPQKSTAFQLYPNPSQGLYTLSFSSALPPLKVNVYQSTGQLIQEIIPQGNSLQLDLSAYQTGMYLVSLHYDSSISHAKLIKE